MASCRLALLALATSVTALSAQGRASLVRCGPDARAMCLKTLVDAPATRTDEWRVEVDDQALSGVSVTASDSLVRPVTLMILVDVSGSMRGTGIEFSRAALRLFIDGLPATDMRVAVAPFESRAVSERIAGAAFQSPPEAMRQLDRLPEPSPAGNTALYSALALGTDRLAREVEAAADGSRPVVILLTDGRNDVGGRGDDPGLLQGLAGRSEATRQAAAAAVDLWVVGLGRGVDAMELQALAGSGRRPSIVETDPVALGRALAGIREALVSVREVLVPLPQGVGDRLARLPARVSIVGGGEPLGSAAWRPPLFSLPAFGGTAVASTPPAAGFLTSGRWLVLGGAGVGWLLLWLVVPLGLWRVPRTRSAPESLPPEAVVEAEEPASAPAPETVGVDGGGLRRDVREAPARSLADDTAELALPDFE